MRLLTRVTDVIRHLSNYRTLVCSHHGLSFESFTSKRKCFCVQLLIVLLRGMAHVELLTDASVCCNKNFIFVVYVNCCHKRVISEESNL